ncbi:ATP-grasp superfamily protein [Colletotrichum truncatum]|uniref:ATP-grasp superfamily protein n=1 Tax=Colletotrichum truncatum TaxID=5467 RepID=A0ACC3YPD6_COLTU|nr:ATP-grasp superfamily protein [Colletotrichum truncatum]XP_036576077.1 ATP-grasp superfamily protein [Colletotrichum truncatum]KAF6780824.1 ATP-grasp superfamily protein [Colletotrichum truncatum]KAF6782760.1 ATP-grasp superfamily protein [Colletotrichum truncatum]
MTGLEWNLVLKNSEKQVILQATATTVRTATSGAGQRHWCLDLEAVSEQLPRDSSFVIDLDETNIAASLLRNLIHQDSRHATILRLVFSSDSGTVIRPDFITYRLHGYDDIQLAVGFLDPLSPVAATNPDQAINVKTKDDFLSLLQNAVGGATARASKPEDTTLNLRARLDEEFAKRLSIPWTVPQPLTQKRVFWVQGRANIEASQQFYKAARALGITLVVLDEPGHWLEDNSGPHAHYREAFIPIGIAGDEGLTQRVVEAVRAYPHPVHGVVCISDVRLPLVARACEILGLPTSSSTAYANAGNKGASREIESAASGQEDGFVLHAVQDLETVLAERGGKLTYPLIVKPCTGWNSDCVVKVRNEDELRAAVLRASERHASSAARSTSVVIEPYIDGPEVDANFIVLNGDVLFCDVTDDFPCSADLPETEGTKAANFMETLMDVPSALPDEEKVMMRNSLAGSIARLGFQSGVFHCEARVRDSRGYYAIDPTDDILDLKLLETAPSKAASCFLHEVNARPPGYINCVAALLAHGVDYYAVRLLLSLGSEEDARVKALSQPFLHGKPQYILGISVLAPTRSGIMGSEDAVRDFLEANQDLKRHVVHFQTVKEKGEWVHGPDSSELWCVGYVIVVSKEGRRECLKLDREVRKRFDYILQDE